MTGQLRTGGLVEVQERLAASVVRPLGASVFAVISAEHALGHVDYHIPRGGCHRDPRKCGARNGSDEMAVSAPNETGAPIDTDVDWHLPSRRAAVRASSTAAELRGLVTGPLAPSSVRVLNDSEAVAAATARFGPAAAGTGGTLFQVALRARNRLCLGELEADERASGRRFDYVVRLRPDYVLDACALPPRHKWPRGLERWASTHMDFIEIMTRDVAQANLGLWSDPDPPQACLIGRRVESCAHYAMCRAGANVTAMDSPSRPPHDAFGPRVPGLIVRPCCDPDSMLPRALLSPLPSHVWCPLHRRPYLHGWWFHLAARDMPDRVHLDAANRGLGPRCDKNPAPLPPGAQDDDDDDHAEEDRGDDDNDDNNRGSLSWRHEWADVAEGGATDSSVNDGTDSGQGILVASSEEVDDEPPNHDELRRR